ncbi:MAG: sulfotransferase domain-containing protein [Pseudomonadales bacterium]
MFDKVLHNDHHVAPHLLNTDKTKAIFSLRDPVKTIPSIMALYAKEDPAHEFNDAEFSTQYYIDRAEELVLLASKMDREYFYYDAEVMTQQTEQCLARLSKWLNLSSPLSASYSMQKKTSMSRYGDTSETLKSGKIERSKSESTPFQLTPELSRAATEAYMRCREALANRTSASCLNIN